MKLQGKNIKLTIIYFILIFFTVLFLYPIIWLFLNSFKSNTELFDSPWSFPALLSLDNYKRAIIFGNIGRYFINSLIVTIIVVLLSTVLSAMAAYGIERLKWKKSKLVLSVFLLGLTIPSHATIIPLFSMFNSIRINNTYMAVIIPHIVFTLPISIFILTGFFQSIPLEMEEAAFMDGYSIPKSFIKIIFPISTPSIVTVGVITFITAWNDLLFPQIFLSDPSMMTLPVGLTTFNGRYSTDYVGMIAAVVITIVPSIITYSIMHKRIIDGMVAGAVKG